jgi:hypothetical protein
MFTPRNSRQAVDRMRFLSIPPALRALKLASLKRAGTGERILPMVDSALHLNPDDGWMTTVLLCCARAESRDPKVKEIGSSARRKAIAGEVAGCRRRGIDGVLWRLNRLEPTPGGPARHAPGTRASERRFRIADGGAGSDHFGRASYR